MANKATATRDDMVSAARSAYASAAATGGERYDAARNYITKTGESAKNNAFETWSESELKSYLDSFGIVSLTFTLLPFLFPRRREAQPRSPLHGVLQGGDEEEDLMRSLT